ncbi:MAG: arginyltransferase [Pseudomonadales bacterium]|nr:arginyltransferase [Pseudomonadales bacterium]
MSQQSVTLLLTHPHPCSYLPDQIATTAFVNPECQITPFLFSRLAEMGFRRSGEHIYRPQCGDCQACVPVRIPVQQFIANRSQIRCIKRNSDLQVRQLSSIDNDTCYALYEKYINSRHGDGDMYPATREQYQNFLCVAWPHSFSLCYYQGERLIAVSVCDRFDNGYSAVYTFYDPDEDKRSLGVYAILNQIARAQLEGLDYLYLGYWIENCNKMRYKTQYQPLEYRIDKQWRAHPTHNSLMDSPSLNP